MANATAARVGIVGVGRMGLAMLKHLVKHGYQVTACDIDDTQLAKARAAGAATVKTPAEVARATDFVIIGVGYDDEVNAVVLGPDGLLTALGRHRGAGGSDLLRAIDEENLRFSAGATPPDDRTMIVATYAYTGRG